MLSDRDPVTGEELPLDPEDMEATRPDDMDDCSGCAGFGEVGVGFDVYGVEQTDICRWCGGDGRA